jgi:hypothetical protein
MEQTCCPPISPSKMIEDTLWLFNITMENCPFIDGLPIKNGGSFHGYVSHNQMVNIAVWFPDM